MDKTILIYIGVGLIFFIAFLAIIITKLGIKFKGWKEKAYITFILLGLGAGFYLPLWATGHYIVGAAIATVFIGLIVLKFKSDSEAGKGKTGKEREEAIEKSQEQAQNSLLVGCDSITEGADGYHYSLTITWQDHYAYPDEDICRGTMTFVAYNKFLEEGKVYQFDERALTNLGYDKYSTLREGGIDITGVSPESFVEGDVLLAGMMNTVLNIQHKQVYGEYAEGTVLGTVENVNRKVNKVKRTVMGISFIIISLIIGIFMFNIFKSMNGSFSKASLGLEGTTDVKAVVTSVDQTTKNTTYHLRYTYKNTEYESSITLGGEKSYNVNQKVNISIKEDYPTQIKGIGTGGSIGSALSRARWNIIFSAVISFVILAMFIFAGVRILKTRHKQ